MTDQVKRASDKNPGGCGAWANLPQSFLPTSGLIDAASPFFAGSFGDLGGGNSFFGILNGPELFGTSDQRLIVIPVNNSTFSPEEFFAVGRKKL